MSRLGPVRAIAATELRRKLRRLRGNTRQLAATALAAVFLLPVSLVVVGGAFVAGRALTDGTVSDPVALARTGAAYAWAGAVVVAAWRAYVAALPPDTLDGMLTTVSHRTLLGGVMLAELSMWTVLAAVAGGVAAVAFAVGAGAPVAVPALLIALAVGIGTAIPVGFAVALAVRNVGVRSAVAARLRTPLAIAFALVYGWAVATSSVGAVLAPAAAALEPTPVAWLADLALLGTHPAAAPVRGVGAVVAAAALIALIVPVSSRLAALAWYADGVATRSESDDGADAEPGERASEERAAGGVAENEPASVGVLARAFSRPVAGVARADWARARRAPITLTYAVYPLLVLLSPVSTSVREGAVAGSLPLWLALCGAWIAGGLFALNAVGGQGATLPVVLLGDSPGRALVRGHVVAGLVLVAPVAVAATAATALVGPQGPASVLTLAALAAVLSLSAGPMASGIGVALPKFEAVSVSRGSEAVLPSMLAFAGYSLALIAVALPGVLGHSAILGHAIADWTGLGRVAVAGTGTAVTAVAGLAAGVVSMRYAVSRVDAYRLD